MAQQNWNYYMAPEGTESRTNALVGMVQNAANSYAANKAKEEQKAELKRREDKRDSEINFNRNEKQLKQQQDSMQMYLKDVRDASSTSGYVNGVLSKTYTMEDKTEFAELSRQVATKSCGACTEQLSRISEMKAEPGITKNFIELFSAEFAAMDADIENNVFDKNNNSSLLALRGVLQGRKGYETGYDYGIRRLEDGTQELWITGPDVRANRGNEYVINSKELNQAAENGGGVYASGYDIDKELQSVDNSLRTIDDNGNPGVYKEEFLGKPKERISSDGKEIETIRSRDPKDAESIYNQQIKANAVADFDNPASAIATWNTKLAKKGDKLWDYSDWESLPANDEEAKARAKGGIIPNDIDTQERRIALYEERMRDKFKSQIHTDFDKDIIISKRENPNYKEGSDSPTKTQTIFEDMTKDLSSSFREAFPGMDNNIDIKGDIVTINLAVTEDDEATSQTYDFTKKDDFVGFYTMLAKERGNFKGDSDKIKAALETYRNKVKAEWEKLNKDKPKENNSGHQAYLDNILNSQKVQSIRTNKKT